MFIITVPFIISMTTFAIFFPITIMMIIFHFINTNTKIEIE